MLIRYHYVIVVPLKWGVALMIEYQKAGSLLVTWVIDITVIGNIW
jgi:hypothetical protein